MIAWLKRLFKIHTCDNREVFCVGRFAFVKCMDCGNESIPWEVSERIAADWRETNGERLKKLTNFVGRVP